MLKCLKIFSNLTLISGQIHVKIKINSGKPLKTIINNHPKIHSLGCHLRIKGQWEVVIWWCNEILSSKICYLGRLSNRISLWFTLCKKSISQLCNAFSPSHLWWLHCWMLRNERTENWNAFWVKDMGLKLKRTFCKLKFLECLASKRGSEWLILIKIFRIIFRK